MPKQVKQYVRGVGTHRASLMRSEVTGLQYYDYAAKASKIKAGTPLTLVREKSNAYDGNATAVYYKKSKIGFVRKENNALIAGLLDAGMALDAYVINHNKDSGMYKGDERLMVAIYATVYNVLLDEDAEYALIDNEGNAVYLDVEED